MLEDVGEYIKRKSIVRPADGRWRGNARRVAVCSMGRIAFDHQPAFLAAVLDTAIGRCHAFEVISLVARRFIALRAVTFQKLFSINCQMTVAAAQFPLRVAENGEVRVGAIVLAHEL